MDMWTVATDETRKQAEQLKSVIQTISVCAAREDFSATEHYLVYLGEFTDERVNPQITRIGTDTYRVQVLNLRKSVDHSFVSFFESFASFVVPLFSMERRGTTKTTKDTK